MFSLSNIQSFVQTSEFEWNTIGLSLPSKIMNLNPCCPISWVCSINFPPFGFTLSTTIDEGFSVPRPGLEPGWTYMSEGF